jgi:hypothetical protein
MPTRRPRYSSRLEVRLGPKTKARLRRLAKGYGQPVADIIRGLCSACLDPKSPALKAPRAAPPPLNAPRAIPPRAKTRKKAL